MPPWRLGDEHEDGRAERRRPILYAALENIRAGKAQAGLRTHAVGGLRLAVCVALRVVGRSVGRSAALRGSSVIHSYLQVQNVMCMEVGILLRAFGTLDPERARTSHPTSRVWRRAVHPICWEAVTPAYSFWLKACGLEP